jgi:hypothetical protein
MVGVPAFGGEGGEDGFEEADALWSVNEEVRRMLVPVRIRSAGEDVDVWSGWG